MTRILLTFAIALALFAVGYALGKRRVPVSPCPETVPEDARWQKRIDNLDSLIAEEKANDRLRSKRP